MRAVGRGGTSRPARIQGGGRIVFTAKNGNQARRSFRWEVLHAQPASAGRNQPPDGNQRQRKTSFCVEHSQLRNYDRMQSRAATSLVTSLNEACPDRITSPGTMVHMLLQVPHLGRPLRNGRCHKLDRNGRWANRTKSEQQLVGPVGRSLRRSRPASRRHRGPAQRPRRPPGASLS